MSSMMPNTIRAIRMATESSQATSIRGLRYQGFGSASGSKGSTPSGGSNPCGGWGGKFGGGTSPVGGSLTPKSACCVGRLWKSSRGPLDATAPMVLTAPANLLMAVLQSVRRPHSEGVDLVDADEHAVLGLVVGEAGAIDVGDDRPALGGVGLVVDLDGRDGPQIAQHPLHLAAGGDADAVGVLTVLQRGVGEGRLAADGLLVDLAARHSGFGLDEDVAVLIGWQRDGAGRVRGARRRDRSPRGGRGGGRGRRRCGSGRGEGRFACARPG